MLNSCVRVGPALRRFVVRSTSTASKHPLRALDEFLPRHVGPRDADISAMLGAISPSLKTLDALIDQTVPPHIRLTKPLELAPPATETEALAELKAMAALNRPAKSFIGMGYYDTLTPAVITRNVLENPVWYTSYTPYQAEISQGRLESLLNYQTMVCDLTGLDIANASLLDEATAAAEAMHLCTSSAKGDEAAVVTFLVAPDVHPQTLAVVRTRAEGMGVRVLVADPSSVDWAREQPCGVLLQYPNTYGLSDASGVQTIVKAAHDAGALVVVATDLLACTVLRSPGELGADIAIGSAQRFGVPMGFGGPHAGFMSTRDSFKRRLPGRIIGVSVDAQGGRALRMAMQTREQHIRRDKATSNICTAQALLANMAAFYAIYHGPKGLRAIAERVHTAASTIAAGLRGSGLGVSGGSDLFFDTVTVEVKGGADRVIAAAAAHGLNLRRVSDHSVGISVDEATTAEHVRLLIQTVGGGSVTPEAVEKQAVAAAARGIPAPLRRTTPYLTHSVFSQYRSETQLMRYIHRLGSKDISLTHSMIPLGSCTMKLNAASEMMPVSWAELASVHPFAPADQTKGWTAITNSVSEYLRRITGFAAVSLQPNSGAAGEYAGLMAIRSYLRSKGETHRNVCLIPVSAHGTNPASAVMAGMRVVVVASDNAGNVDWEDLKAKALEHKDRLAALMITYPSTYGVFEEQVSDFCALIHGCGAQVYMDGANMNAQVALTSPGHIGADVCHLNLHKTFCIPHGGGGPGVGAIGVAKHLAPFLPGHPVVPTAGWQGDVPGVAPHTNLAVAAAPYGSALILPISWMYIRMLGAPGLLKATQIAILNANYLAALLSPHYPLLFRGSKGRVAHELIIDLRPFKTQSKGAIGEEDVAKRLMDFGFHSPTMSWPVAGTLMIEPTESEDKGELDRFAAALISIRGEIEDVLQGRVKASESPLKHAPHTAAVVTAEKWEGRAYSRETAAFPAPWVREGKLWPTVGRVDNVYGDRHLVCTCPSVESYA